jgi:hypothetical protein
MRVNIQLFITFQITPDQLQLGAATCRGNARIPTVRTNTILAHRLVIFPIAQQQQQQNRSITITRGTAYYR